ncbi:MAG: hypothetical protein ACJ8AF_00780, partial [Gemmatimonadaceae bacterium]
LGTRLNPERLKQQAKDKIRGATIGKVQTMAQTTVDKASNAGRSVTDIVRDNPLPAALIAAGISWMAWNSKRGKSSISETSSVEGSWEDSERSYRSTSQRYRSSEYGQSSGISQSGNGDDGLPEKVRERAGTVVDGVGSLAQRTTEKTRSAAGAVAETAKAQTDKVADALQSNPLPLGLIAAALGVAAGLALPTTQKERELVGEKRDEIVDKAKGVVTEKKEQVKRVAERVVSEARTAATQAAREEGLTEA